MAASRARPPPIEPTLAMNELLLALRGSGALLAAADLVARVRGLPGLVDASFLSNELAPRALRARFSALRASAGKGALPDECASDARTVFRRATQGRHLRMMNVGETCTFGGCVRCDEA